MCRVPALTTTMPHTHVQRDVEAEKEAGLAAEKDARAMAQRVAAAQRAEKEVSNGLCVLYVWCWVACM